MTAHISTPRGEITVRLAVAGDAGSLFKLRIEALSLHPEAFAADVEKTAAAGVQAWEQRIQEYSHDQSGAIILACAGDEVIGMTGIARGHWPKTRHSANLWGVYVSPPWRGLHAAEAIIDGCVAWAFQNDLTVLTLGVITSNTPAIRAYAHCGFSVFGVQPRVTLVDGVYNDDLMMVKYL